MDPQLERRVMATRTGRRTPPPVAGSLAPSYLPDNTPQPMDPPLERRVMATRTGRRTPPPVAGSLAPSYLPDKTPQPMDPLERRVMATRLRPRNPAPFSCSLAPSYLGRRNPVDPKANFPFVYVPPRGTKAGHFVPRKTVPEFYAHHTPQPPPPGFEEKEQHMPGPSEDSTPAPSVAYNQLPLAPSLGPPLLLRKQRDWGIDFYMRVDHLGWYHMYPSVGGPFQELHEAENAIQHFLDGRRDPNMYKDNVSAVDIAVQRSFYWPDGTRRKGSVDGIRDSQRQLATALVDKYNEDNHHLGDCAYELTKVELYQSFCEGDLRIWYNHINFTAKPKRAVYSELFFAEVISMQGEELPVSCLCVIQSTDHGFCTNCANNGNHVRHPSSVRYAGGHTRKTFKPFNGPKLMGGYCDDNLEAEEARFRYTLEGCDLSRPVVFPGSLAKVYTGPPVWDGGCWRMEEVGAGSAS